MDKQNTPTKYVRITKAEEFKWYSDKVGWVYPVEQEMETHYRILSRDDGNKIGFTIAKSDCEPYEFPSLPTPEKIIGIDKAACCYAEMVEYIGSPRGGTWNLAETDFKAGVEWTQKKIKAAPVQEGHTIRAEQLTEDQVSTLKRVYYDLENEDCRGALQDLRRSFPTVFKPIKQVIAVTDKKGTEYYTGEVMGILRTTKNKAEAYVIEHQGHGSELMKFLQETYDECQFSFDNYE